MCKYEVKWKKIDRNLNACHAISVHDLILNYVAYFDGSD